MQRDPVCLGSLQGGSIETPRISWPWQLNLDVSPLDPLEVDGLLGGGLCTELFSFIYASSGHQQWEVLPRCVGLRNISRLWWLLAPWVFVFVLLPPPNCSFLFLVQNSCLTESSFYIQKAKSLNKSRTRHSSVYKVSKPREEVEQWLEFGLEWL